MVRKREAVEKRVMKTQGRFKRKKKRGSTDGSVKKEEAIHTRKINEVCVCVCVVCHPDIQRRLEGNQAYGRCSTRGIIMSSYT